MAYEQQNWNNKTWEKGQDNFQNMLNHMEDGIDDAHEARSKVQWGTIIGDVEDQRDLIDLIGRSGKIEHIQAAGKELAIVNKTVNVPALTVTSSKKYDESYYGLAKIVVPYDTAHPELTGHTSIRIDENGGLAINPASTTEILNTNYNFEPGFYYKSITVGNVSFGVKKALLQTGGQTCTYTPTEQKQACTTIGALTSSDCIIQSTLPTTAASSTGIHIAVCNTDPGTYQTNWIYFIKETD